MRGNPSSISQASPLFIVLSGPSGAGKDTVLARMKELGCPLHYTVTTTTRPQRPGERDGVDYHFVSMAKFREMVENKEFLESAKVYGNWYGVPQQQVREALAKGLDVIMKVDVQGASTIKGVIPQAVFIFLAPSSVKELVDRLRQRSTESTMDLDLRIGMAQEELKHMPMFDYVVVNHPDKADLAVDQINAIITAEKCRLTPRVIQI